VEPAVPRSPVDDITPRTAVTIWPLVTYLIVFNWLVGFLAGMAFFTICALAGALSAAVTLASLLVGVAVWAAGWLRTSIQFTPGDLVLTMLLRRRRIPWTRIHAVTLQDVWDHETGQVTNQRVNVRYRRDPQTPLGPVPTILGEYRAWARAHFRTVNLPLLFPPANDSAGSSRPRRPRTWIGRRSSRQREIIRQEFAARGYSL
jgi:hypothetical protein